jgi:hypothetical protein
VRLDALTGLTSGQRAKLRRRMAEHLGTAVIARPGGWPSALRLEGSVDLVCVLLRTNLTQDQAAALFDTHEPAVRAVEPATSLTRPEVRRVPILGLLGP